MSYVDTIEPGKDTKYTILGKRQIISTKDNNTVIQGSPALLSLNKASFKITPRKITSATEIRISETRIAIPAFLSWSLFFIDTSPKKIIW